MTDLEALFRKAYSNLPEDEQNQIIAVIEGKPITWNKAFDEIKAKTPLGDKILKKLEKMRILNE